MTAPIKLTLTAAVTGTKSSSVVNITVNPAPTISGNAPAGTVGTPYSATLTASGGSGALKWGIAGGSLPAGLTFNTSTGVISGTPTAAGSATITLQVTDSSDVPLTVTSRQTIQINSGVVTLSIGGNPPAGTVGVAYTTTLQATGGTSPYVWSVISGNLPAGLSLSASGVISGTPTSSGSSVFTIQAQDASGNKASAVFGITINAANSVLSIGNPTLPGGTVGVPYTGTIPISGGVGPYTCAVAGGSLPAGLTLNSNCTVSGTPTTAGTSTVAVSVTDSGNPTQTATGTVTITISPASLTLTLTSLPNATVGTPYNATIGVSGGTSPYSCTITNGTLPAGLTLTGCMVHGTPTTAGVANLTVKATDSSNPTATTSGPVSLTVLPAPLTLTISSLPSGTVGVAYNSTVGVSGGTSPYTCTITGLPAGLTSSGCTVTGTPTSAGTSTLTVHATDSSNPTESTNGTVTLTINPASVTLVLAPPTNATVGTPYTGNVGVTGGTAPYTCTITGLPAGLTANNCSITGTPTAAGTSTLTVHATDSSSPTASTTGTVSLVINPAAVTLTLTAPPAGTINTAYTGSVGVTGGTAPYTCTITGLPAGLTANNCAITGTPTAAGTSTLTVHATDSSSPTASTTGTVSLVINPAAVTLTLTAPPAGTINTAYTGSVGVTGGTAPYTCTITGLPPGLTANNCAISGTPTAAGTSTLTVHATDSSSPTASTTGTVSLVINPAAVTLTLTAPPAGTINTAYTGSVGVTGGTAPYTCTITGLPAGLTANNCSITGTPTAAGTSTLTVHATDSSSPTASTTGTVSLVINPAAVTLTLTAPPAGTINTAYTGSVGVTGGTAPYTCTITGLPAGLTANNCAITGTPTAAGTSTLTVHATDSSSPTASTTGTVALVINPAPLTLTGTLPNAILGQSYSQTLNATGGVGPYTYQLINGTSLPAGLSLATDGTISGTPTAPGAVGFTVQVTDSSAPQQTATHDFVLLVVYPSGPNNNELNGPYAFLFQGYDDVLVGVLAYQTATIGSFTADGNGLINAGESDSNHQTSGATLTSNQFYGSYQIGADNRGMMALTTLNPDGSIAGTKIYAISVKAPATPGTAATQAQMIEFDGSIIIGSRGSGTILQQTTAAFAAGLSGNYAFGVSGDTPCLVSCAVGLSGPVVAVGQFTASAGIVTGTSDANVGATNFANGALSGAYQAADSNGRLTFSATVSSAPGIFPTHYVIYVVDAAHIFLMSDDTHSQFALLAGTGQTQTQASFDNTSLNGPIIGYENAQSDPGLLGATLQNVLNVSTSTIFRVNSTASTNGTCNFTNVDVAGINGLVNQLSGGVSALTGADLLAILGRLQSTGSANCSVTTNGRGTLNYPAPSGLLAPVLNLLGLNTPPAPRIFYLVSPNHGYFLESGYAGLGYFEGQINKATFTLADFNGTFVYGSQPAATLASINTSGYIHADGAGNANGVTDLNIGVGNLNILQLGVANSGTYAINSTPPPLQTFSDANAGRFTYGTNVIYEITPGRFVLLDTNLLTTSPTVTLLY
ncbi:beta strand repeat-containing protein [Edaphobacter flagellatus]|uniref:beta strand repeat-containing protein n=1 Tax=Edaphobacter flagellatus TaxID=1933044 RepID=UPI0021B33326|nr:putative Ig domain-containing protein [Edaphobacter flagellatus]